MRVYQFKTSCLSNMPASKREIIRSCTESNHPDRDGNTTNNWHKNLFINLHLEFRPTQYMNNNYYQSSSKLCPRLKFHSTSTNLHGKISFPTMHLLTTLIVTNDVYRMLRENWLTIDLIYIMLMIKRMHIVCSYIGKGLLKRVYSHPST